MAQASVLVVDDEEFNLEIIEEYLESFDYDLVLANDGVEAWEYLETEPDKFDVVLLDRMMPNLDGIEVLKRIKQHPDMQSLPVVLQTAAASRQDVAEGLDAGAYYYLTKPFDEEVLQSIVKAALDDHNRYRHLQEKLSTGTRIMGIMDTASFRFQTLDEARDLASFLANASPDPERVVSGLSELLLNAVEHGNLGITYDDKSQLNREGRWLDEVGQRLALPENQQKYVEVEMQNVNGEMHILIKDQGEGFDWESYLEIDPARAYDSHGRGIAMARILSFDSMEYLGKGNEVKVIINV